jgi:translation elongation factor EF-Ts
MPLLNEKLKMISCSDFRLFLKKMINDKIEKEWTENFVENLNFIMVSRNTIKRRYEDKGIDLIKLINDISYYKHVKKRVNSRGNLEFQHKY